MKLPTILGEVTTWIENGMVGRFTVMRSHKGALGAGSEDIVKMHELDKETANKICDLVRHFGALRINIICNVNSGEPDRIELFRMRG